MGGGRTRRKRACRRNRRWRPYRRDLTGPDWYAILALAAASVAVSNDSGLLHVAAAPDTAMRNLRPTSAWHWAPLNPIARWIENREELPLPTCQ